MAKPNNAVKEPNDSIEMTKSSHTLSLLSMAIEVQRGALAESRRIQDDEHNVAVIWLTVTLGEKAATTKAIIVNGELFVSALDAGAATTRERSRLLAVARRAGNA